MKNKPKEIVEIKEDFKKIYGDYRISTLPLWLEDREKVWKWITENFVPKSALQQAEARGRESVLKELKKTITQKFPRGERQWCIQCARRIYKSLKQKQNGKL